MNKQTAVEWLFAHLLPHLDWSKTEDRIRFRQLEQEAKAMEWEQLIEAHADGQYLNSVSLTKRMCLDNAESYYNEKYGK
jgi:hypothetical protein